MVDEIVYNKKHKVWHIRNWGRSFATRNKAMRFKKLWLEKNKLENRIDKIKHMIKFLTI